MSVCPTVASKCRAMSGAVSWRGLWRGLQSRPFTPADLMAAADQALGATGSVFADVDSEGYLCARGGPAGAGGATLAARARLAGRAAACDAVLAPAGGAALQLRLRLVRAVPPLHDVRVWLHDGLLARLPPAAADGEYRCEACGERFPEPNPLRAHLYLRCEPPAPARFWRRLALDLQAAAPAGPRPGLQPAAPAGPRLGPRLQALAASWARRAPGGHACLYCGKLYSRRYGLKIHIRTHTGYRPLRCRHCARAFGDPSNLNKHVRLHAAAAP